MPVDNPPHPTAPIGHAAVGRPETIGRKTTVRLALKPALSRSWRDSDTLQFGTVPQHAGVLAHASGKVLREFLDLVDGTRDRPALLAESERIGFGRDPADSLLDLLEEAGVLDDAEAAAGALALFPQPHRELLGPDPVSYTHL